MLLALGFVLLASTLVSGKNDQPQSCLYDGRRYTPGATVRTNEACLVCVCAQGALSCRRRSCAPLPEPPPRCHVIHRRGECCSELRCPDGVKHLEALARFDDTAIDTPLSVGHACVEGGTVYAAGSAMSSNTACEQCFCLGGARRCVRPRCLPPPPGCQARPAPGACCPQRYYCEHIVTKPPDENIQHDCLTPKGIWVMEGQRVMTSEEGLKCTQCFCLRGSIRCQHLSCAPALQGCTPLVQPEQCCPYQYQCDRSNNGTNLSILHNQNQNRLKDENRSFHISKTSKRETMTTELTTTTDEITVSVAKKEFGTNNLDKVKRNKDEPNTTNYSLKPEKNNTTISNMSQTTQMVNDITSTSMTETVRIEEATKGLPTEQPEGSIKVIINGTINCTAELSSTSLLLNISDVNDTMWIDSQTQPRIPIINTIDTESLTFSPNDIITERFHNEGIEENETFIVNVTSSLRTNTTQSMTSTIKPSSVLPVVSPSHLSNVNVSKIKKEEYDYDYTEPTLPPSLPNLKIIPFVAADAVVEEDISSKESIDYAVSNRDDKFPVYYPNEESKEAVYATHKEDVYNPTQYPIFVSKKVENQFPHLTQEADTNAVYSSITNRVQEPVQEYTVTASLGNSVKINKKPQADLSNSNTEFEINAPVFNLFSPPIETEGGFIPKGPEIIDDYYSVYSSTPTNMHNIPHLTTSMQLEPKDECMSSDGRRVGDGDSISLACSVCTCAWGELHCSPRPCFTPSGCSRKDTNISITDLCCGELFCDNANKSILPLAVSHSVEAYVNETKYDIQANATTARSIIENNDIMYGHINNNSNTSQNKEIFDHILPMDMMQSPSTEKTLLHVTTTEIPEKEAPENANHSQEYDDDDEGFSLGNVLKLLLSDNYDTTTEPAKKLTTMKINTSPKTITTSFPPKIKQPPSPENGFVPVTKRFPYITPTSLYPHKTVDRIDHLLLGESNAISMTDNITHRPLTFKPIPLSTVKKMMTTIKTTERPITTKSVEIASKDGFENHVEARPPSSNFLSSLSLGLPKLAGCNIYGRMYRVERIIAELSSACQECKCTELGVHCRSLSCS